MMSADDVEGEHMASATDIEPQAPKRRFTGLVAGMGGAIVLLGFFAPYLADIEPGRHTPRLIAGFALPVEQIPLAGHGVERFSPGEWVLAYVLAALAVTLLMFALHYALTTRPGISRILRRLALLGGVATIAIAVSIVLRVGSTAPLTPTALSDYASVALYGLRHLGPGVYLALVGFLVARLDPTI